MEWAPSDIVQLLMVLGVGTILPAFLKGVWKQVTGRHDREAARVQQFIADRDAAERERDEQSRRARIAEEYAQALRFDMMHAGIAPEQIRPWPHSHDPYTRTNPKETP